MQKVIAVVGPTASGKTGLSIALAKTFGGEIVSADSMQIYHQMNIGTAKPSMEERCGVPHHLMGHVSVEETYNVAAYVEDARKVLENLKKRKCLPILCGGTGLYVDHLLGNTEFFDIPLESSVRQKYQAIANEQGNEALYAMLREVDPILAGRLHPNDTKRVIRGLEVYDSTGRRLSSYQADSARCSPYEVLYIGLNFKDRSLLYDRINRRVDIMVEQGLLKEIQALKAGYQLSSTARAAIGYKEILDAMEAEGSLEDAIELVKQKSRNYAKRQLTWFKKNKAIHWFDREDYSESQLIHEASILAEDFLKGGSL